MRTGAIFDLVHGSKVRCENPGGVGISHRGTRREHGWIDLTTTNQAYACRTDVVGLNQDVFPKLPLNREMPLLVVRQMQVGRKRSQGDWLSDRPPLERIRSIYERVRIVARRRHRDGGKSRRRRKLGVELGNPGNVFVKYSKARSYTPAPAARGIPCHPDSRCEVVEIARDIATGHPGVPGIDQVCRGVRADGRLQTQSEGRE